MRRRRILSILWAIGFVLFIVVYIYLSHTAGNAKKKETNKPALMLTVIQELSHMPTTQYRSQFEITYKTSTEGVQEMSTVALAPATKLKHTTPRICTPDPDLLVGAIYVNQTEPEMKEVEEQLSVKYGGFVKKGGAYKPKGCIAKNKLAIVVPYRNRAEHLRIFLRHMHPIMQRQMHDYRIIIVEQAGNYSFNRATLINVGFLEALKIGRYKCFVFHDVDHILENDRNDYGCPEAPKLLGVSVDRFYRRFPYMRYFGGVGAFSKEQFQKINGYSNKFWGWGGEDDDAYNRIRAAGYNLLRSRSNIGRYLMLKKHHVRAKAGPNRFMLLKTSSQRMYEDGLSDVKYTVKSKTEYPLYTHIHVQLAEELDVPPTIIWTLNPE